MDIEQVLEKCIDPFRAVVIESIESLFMKKATDGGDWNIVERLYNPCALACALGAANQKFAAEFAVGAEKTALEAIIGTEHGNEMFLDALGELANSFCALFNTEKKIEDLFGILIQVPPIYIDEGSFFYFPKIKAISGTALVDGNLVWAGFAIRESK